MADVSMGSDGRAIGLRTLPWAGLVASTAPRPAFMAGRAPTTATGMARSIGGASVSGAPSRETCLTAVVGRFSAVEGMAFTAAGTFYTEWAGRTRSLIGNRPRRPPIIPARGAAGQESDPMRADHPPVDR